MRPDNIVYVYNRLIADCIPFSANNKIMMANGGKTPKTPPYSIACALLPVPVRGLEIVREIFQDPVFDKIYPPGLSSFRIPADAPARMEEEGVVIHVYSRTHDLSPERFGKTRSPGMDTPAIQGGDEYPSKEFGISKR